MYLDKKKEISTEIKLKMWLFNILEPKSIENKCNFTKIFQSGQSVGGQTEGYNCMSVNCKNPFRWGGKFAMTHKTDHIFLQVQVKP